VVCRKLPVVGATALLESCKVNALMMAKTLNGLVEKADATSAPVPSLLLQRKLHLFRN
jgi:hypothetical protein